MIIGWDLGHMDHSEIFEISPRMIGYATPLIWGSRSAADSRRSLPKAKHHYKLKAQRKAQRRARRLNR